MGNGKEPIWPAADFSRVPFTVFTDQDVFDREQDRVFHGPVWCYLALEAELPNPGDYITTFVGNTQVVVTHAEDGGFHAFINRCAHRGTTVVRNLAGNAKDFTCIYHHWCYDLKGNLVGGAVRARHERRGRHAGGLRQGGPRPHPAQAGAP